MWAEQQPSGDELVADLENDQTALRALVKDLDFTENRVKNALGCLGAQAIRSFVKSIASLGLIPQNPLFFIFFMNFLIAFYNKGRKAGHDLLSRTSVVPGFLPDEETKELDRP